MESALCCTQCGEVVFKSQGTSTKLRAKVIVFRDDQALAVCKGCGSEIPVPVALDTNLMKSIDNAAKLRLYVRK